jgi:hypothetical protein
MKLSIVFFIIPLTSIGVKEGILHNTEQKLTDFKFFRAVSEHCEL